MTKTLFTRIFAAFALTLGLAATSSAVDVGDQMADFTLGDLDGNGHTLSQYAGKTIVLNFFATWCGPCRAEAPQLNALYNEYRSNGTDLIVFQVASSERSGDINQWYTNLNGWRNTYNTAFPILVDSTGAAYQDYGQGFIPHNVVIDKSGTITYSESGYNEFLVRRAIDQSELINAGPPVVQGVSTSRGMNAGTMNVSWDAIGASSSVSNYLVEYTAATTGKLETRTVGALTTSVDIMIPDPSDVYVVRVFANMADGTMSDPSAPKRFAFKPFNELNLNQGVYRTGDSMQVDYRYANYGDSSYQVQTFIALEIGGIFNFYDPNDGFSTTPMPLAANWAAGRDTSGNLFTIDFTGVPLPDVGMNFYMMAYDPANAAAFDFVQVPFSFASN